jgi:hypothetical protein
VQDEILDEYMGAEKEQLLEGSMANDFNEEDEEEEDNQRVKTFRFNTEQEA